jgi:hypothetical protein
LQKEQKKRVQKNAANRGRGDSFMRGEQGHSALGLPYFACFAKSSQELGISRATKIVVDATFVNSVCESKKGVFTYKVITVL